MNITACYELSIVTDKRDSFRKIQITKYPLQNNRDIENMIRETNDDFITRETTDWDDGEIPSENIELYFSRKKDLFQWIYYVMPEHYQSHLKEDRDEDGSHKKYFEVEYRELCGEGVGKYHNESVYRFIKNFTHEHEHDLMVFGLITLDPKPRKVPYYKIYRKLALEEDD